jgi:hypothetical protein
MSKLPTFYIAPGAITGDPVEDRLLRSHEAEAAERQAEFYNYGWVSGGRGISSKTSRGILTSEIDPKTTQINHSWRPAFDWHAQFDQHFGTEKSGA